MSSLYHCKEPNDLLDSITSCLRARFAKLAMIRTETRADKR